MADRRHDDPRGLYPQMGQRAGVILLIMARSGQFAGPSIHGNHPARGDLGGAGSKRLTFLYARCQRGPEWPLKAQKRRRRPSLRAMTGPRGSSGPSALRSRRLRDANACTISQATGTPDSNFHCRIRAVSAVWMSWPCHNCQAKSSGFGPSMISLKHQSRCLKRIRADPGTAPITSPRHTFPDARR